MKDRADIGGSSSIPTGNNRAAGQECRLQEAGSGRRGNLLTQSSYTGTLRISFGYQAEGWKLVTACEVGRWGLYSGGWDCCVNLGQKCLFKPAKNNKKTSRHAHNLDFQRKQRLAASHTFQGPTFTGARSALYRTRLHIKH